MKYFLFFAIFLIVPIAIFSQTPEGVLASAKGLKFDANNLSPEWKANFLNSAKLLSVKRSELLENQVNSELLELEADSQKISVSSLLETVIFANVIGPDEKQVTAIYENNRAQIGDKSIDEMRPQIIEFLRREPEQKAFDEFVLKLRSKYRVIKGRDVTESDLKSNDVLVTINNNEKISMADFEKKNGLQIADFEGDLFDHVKSDLEIVIFDKLVETEASSLQMKPGDFIAQEITNKLREFSDEERERIETGLKKKLFSKYDVKILLKSPKPYFQDISVDDDPVQGAAFAKVTVVMFSDFQCPACAAVHPVLKQVLTEFGTNVRFVVRDFPLMNIHKNAFRAALAANAAKAQGKFFEYADVLYKNQNNLDDKSLVQFAVDLGFNVRQFELDLESVKNAEEVKKDIADGNSYGVSGTPTIFVNGVKIRTLSAENFRNAIDTALKK